MKRTTERALWIGGSAVAALGAVTAAVLLTKKSSAAPATTSTSVTTTGPNTTTTSTQAPAAIPAIPYTAGQPQSQLVSAPGGAYTAENVTGGTLQLTMAGPILSVSPDASYTSSSITGNMVKFTLSGQAGTIVIKWGAGATTVLVKNSSDAATNFT